MQRLLNAAQWDAEAVRDDLCAYVAEHLGDPNAVLIIDETGFLKQGTKSVGVQPQYSGTAGDIENCQIGVFLCYASAKGSAFIDRALYLPQAWTRDHQRRAAAHVPSDLDLRHQTGAGHPHAGTRERCSSVWLGHRRLCLRTGSAAAAVVGTASAALRARRPIDHASRTGRAVGCSAPRRSPRRLPPDQWQRVSAGAGVNGPRWFDWAWREVWWSSSGEDAAAWGQWLLIRRSLSDRTDLSYYVVVARRQDTTLAQVSAVAGARWRIEDGFESAKGECGLDEYEVRRWDAWHRHVTLALLAHAFLNVMRSQDGHTGCAAEELLPVTVPEVRRLVWQLVWARPPTREQVVAWSRWRRRHQRRASRCHARRRARALAREVRL